MSHKTSTARRAAFFAALAETGNQTIAAERARVSRSWVHLHQSTDPAFRAQLDVAIATAKERLRSGAAGVKPMAKWREQAGEELVVRGTNGRRTQIARARLKQWTPRVEARFLAALASCCNVAAACRAVGLSPAAAYYHYHRWPDFEMRWRAALEEGYLRLEMALIETAGRAFEAVDYPPDVPIEPMSFDQAITLLKVHEERVHRTGKPRPHWRKHERSSEEAFASLAEKLDRLARVEQRRAAADPAADARAVAEGMRIVAANGRGADR